MLATQGLLGVVLYLAGLMGLGVLAKAALKNHPERASAAAALAALVIQNQFNFSSVSTSVWAALLLGILLLSSEKKIPAPLLTWRRSVPRRLALTGMVLAAWSFTVWQPLWADRQFQLGQGWMALQQPILALDAMRQSVRWAPYRAIYSLGVGNAANQLTQRAEGDVRQSLLQEAWNNAEASLRYHPQSADLWNNRGVVAMWCVQIGGDTHFMEEAKKSFETALAYDPVFIDAMASLAKWYHLAGDSEAEKAQWRRVLELNPADAMAQSVLGTTLKP